MSKKLDKAFEVLEEMFEELEEMQKESDKTSKELDALIRKQQNKTTSNNSYLN